MRQGDDTELETKRKRADKFIPRLRGLLLADLAETKDEEFTRWMLDVLDAYMMHECRLGSSLSFYERYEYEQR